ncbi:hypothetical protein SDC9_208521 [bioreactor metagenome]|uniref:Uncharacterized protein n=1 Tax=bioreactor metagenome TaxID=1076179 RepID=A0A645JDN2_9ZZZZ
MHRSELLQKIDIPSHQVVLGDDSDRVPKSGQDFQAASGEFKPSLDWLIAIRHPAQAKRFGFPFR